MEKNKLYYEQPYLSEFEPVVTSCEKTGEYYEIKLENTIFYPEGGGQPSDTGQIGPAQVSYVKETKDGEIIHICDGPLEAGQAYTAWIDWQARFDHMQHHSAEHVVSGVIHKLYGADNVGFHIGGEYVTMDYNTALSKEDIEKIEKLSNEAVWKNLPIKTDYFDHTPDMAYRSKKELLGVIRIVTIDGYDVCACCGTQLYRTGEIGLIKIISFQKYKTGSRLFMVCGNRALRDYQMKDDNIAEISAMLSGKPYEAAKFVARLQEEKEQLKYELGKVKFELIDKKSSEIPSGEKIILFEEGLNAEEMKRYFNNLMEKADFVAVFSGNDGDGYKYLMAAKKNLAAVVKDMNVNLNGKGGGKDVAQGHVQATKYSIEAFMNEL